jgi:hypothetical protein
MDAAGKVWTANLDSSDATRIDPGKGPLGADGTTGASRRVTFDGADDAAPVLTDLRICGGVACVEPEPTPTPTPNPTPTAQTRRYRTAS